jgi:hypothetical protein
LTALVIGSPFLANLALAWQSQGATNLMERGGYFGRELSLTELTLALMLIGTAIFLYTRAQVPPLTIALAFAATGAALGLNAHLLTGYNANDFHHFVKMLIQPLVFFLCGAAVIKWLPWCRIGTLCMLATVVLLGLGVYRQVRVADTITQSHDRTASPIQLVETLRSRVAAGSVIGSSDPQVITLLPALSTLWTFVPLGIRSEASNNEILRRYLIVRKLEGATILDVHADFNRMFPTTRMDRFLSYVLFQNFEGALAQLHPRIDQVWSELDLVKDLSARRLDILATVGMPPPLPESTGWQLVMIDPIGKWNIFHLQSLKAASR